MKLKAVILENFRAYNQRVRIELGDLVAFIGKNDIGKSSILDALSIFFGGDVRLDKNDLNVRSTIKTICIGAVFTDLPSELVLDATATTTLADEFLLNADGDLEIHKIFDCSIKSVRESTFAVAIHPAGEAGGLLQKKNSELKELVKALSMDSTGINQRSNPALRRAIRNHYEPLHTTVNNILLDQEDAKKIWESLQKYLPMYALFKSDRSSQDGDSEVQEPLKFAIAEAVKELEEDLRQIEISVTNKAKDVAQRTLDKLGEMAPELAKELSPEFKTERKWDSIFKFALSCEDGIPLNKRGSGVRRLVLLNFFRAEAERRQAQANAPGVVFAIEEPETSQHPSNQRLIVQALMELADQDNTQVILTTHVPGLAGLIPTNSLRYIRFSLSNGVVIDSGTEQVLRSISSDLGILPDGRVRAIVCVEGPNDVVFLKKMCALVRSANEAIIDLSSDPRVVVLPIGGSTLEQWVQHHYLQGLGLPEIHIYDRDTESPPKYQAAADAVNSRGDGSWAVLTSMRETENYLHPAAIDEALEVSVKFGSDDDVPLLVAEAIHRKAADSKPWHEVDSELMGKKVSRAKKRLNSDASGAMTLEMLSKSDPSSEITGWLERISQVVK